MLRDRLVLLLIPLVTACARPGIAAGPSVTPPSVAGAPVPRPSRPVKLALGDGFSCALWSDERARCWGRNDRGQLGDGTLASRAIPDRVLGVEDAVDLVAATSGGCALRRDGSLACWGRLWWHGIFETRYLAPSRPWTIQGLPPIRALGIDDHGGCALDGAGATHCWGTDYDDRGSACSDSNDRASYEPRVMTVLPAATSITVTSSDVCVLDGAGTVTCSRRSHCATDLTAHVALRGASRLATGATCAIDREGTGRCATYDGKPRRWQEGFWVGVRMWATPAQRTTLEATVPDFELKRLRDLSRSCALDVDGHATCWDHVMTDRFASELEVGLARHVDGIERATAIADSGHHACAITDDRIRCWGSNSDGELGDGRAPSSLIPVEVGGLRGSIDLAAGGEGTCGVMADGSVRCAGQLNETGSRIASVPTAVAGVSGARDVETSYDRTCVIRDGGTLTCWGRSGNDGEGGSRSLGPRDMGVRGVVSLAPGSTWMIAQTSRGDRLKFARLHPGAIEPAREFKGATFAAIPLDFGSDVACRITHGELRCGGVRVTPHHDLRSAAFGDGLGCAIDSGNQLWCWTWPTNHGRVFSKPGAVGFEPRHLAELGAVTDLDIDLQGQHACALSTAGDVWCFGHNDRGQLGDGTTTSRVDPVRVALPAHAVQVTVGATHSCARLADGRVWCWGDGRHGQLGIEIPAFTRPPLTAVAPRT